MDIITKRIEKLWLSEDDFTIEETDTEMSDIKEYSDGALDILSNK